VTASLPDSAADQPAKVELFGCTDEAQALREGLYMAAANRYRRRMVSFRTELEGLIPTYGDLIAIAHDMPRWGQGGEVVAWNPETGTLELSEPLEWADGETHYIALRRRDGTVSGPWNVLPSADDRHVVLAEGLDFTPYTGASEERTHFAFGVGEAWSLRARVISIRPRGEQVEIAAVGEDARVHEADLAA
jgi:predicted phage tail protein